MSDTIESLRAEVERLGQQLSTAKADARHWHSGFDDMKAEAGRLHEEGLRAQELHALARAADASAIEAAEAAVAQVESAAHDAIASVIASVRAALARHPRACDRHDDSDPVSCGWKRAVLDVQAVVDEPDWEPDA